MAKITLEQIQNDRDVDNLISLYQTKIKKSLKSREAGDANPPDEIFDKMKRISTLVARALQSDKKNLSRMALVSLAKKLLEMQIETEPEVISRLFWEQRQLKDLLLGAFLGEKEISKEKKKVFHELIIQQNVVSMEDFMPLHDDLEKIKHQQRPLLDFINRYTTITKKIQHFIDEAEKTKSPKRKEMLNKAFENQYWKLTHEISETRKSEAHFQGNNDIPRNVKELSEDRSQKKIDRLAGELAYILRGCNTDRLYRL